VTRRKLPLESPHWWPITQAIEHRRQRTSADKLTALDFTQALKAGRLRALVRYADGHREWLPTSAWDDLYVGGWPPKLAVFSRKLGSQPPGQFFFVWLPDYENIFGDRHAISSSPAQTQEVPEKRGRKASHPWLEIGFELISRVRKKGGVAGNKSTNEWAEEIAQWCEDHYQKAPVYSDLREFVDDVFRAFHIKRK